MIVTRNTHTLAQAQRLPPVSLGSSPRSPACSPLTPVAPGINKMKINIEIEISPDEVGLATELIATLRALTSHVSVKQVTRALLPTLTPSHMSVRPVETPEVTTRQRRSPDRSLCCSAV